MLSITTNCYVSSEYRSHNTGHDKCYVSVHSNTSNEEHFSYLGNKWPVIAVVSTTH